jgi:hypothetical protein
VRARVDALPGKMLLAPECHSVPVTLSEEADKLALDLKARWETEGANWIEQASARSYVHILRYALVYAIADASPRIEPVHLLAAEDLVQYFADGIRRQATAELSDGIAQRILTHMREDPTEGLSRTAISCDVFQKHVAARDLENAIGQLVSLGMLQAAIIPTKGRNKTIYYLTKIGRG